MKRFGIGIDIGGTKIAVTLGTRQGKILAKDSFSSLGGKAPKQSIRDIRTSINKLCTLRKISKSSISAIGVGIPGPMDGTGVIQFSPNLVAWEGLALKKILTQTFRVPVRIENDANAAAVGEHLFGEGRGVSDFIYITISTGVGAGIVANDQLIRGISGSAGEIGHTTIVHDGLLCKCGKKGCLEAYASGTAIANHARRFLKAGAKSKFFKNIPLKDIVGRMVSKAAWEGDRVAIQARHFAAQHMGIGLANTINLLNPQRIILGGGVMETPHEYWVPMMKVARKEAWPLPFKACKIVRSKLGGHVADLGALAVGFDAVAGHP